MKDVIHKMSFEKCKSYNFVKNKGHELICKYFSLPKLLRPQYFQMSHPYLRSLKSVNVFIVSLFIYWSKYLSEIINTYCFHWTRVNVISLLYGQNCSSYVFVIFRNVSSLSGVYVRCTHHGHF